MGARAHANHAVDSLQTLILKLYFFWANYGALTRGTAALGFALLVALASACHLPVCVRLLVCLLVGAQPAVHGCMPHTSVLLRPAIATVASWRANRLGSHPHAPFRRFRSGCASEFACSLPRLTRSLTFDFVASPSCSQSVNVKCR